MVDLITNRNCVYQTAYYVVWCPKYRKAILTDKIAASLAAMLQSICSARNWPIIAIEIQPDHIHLFLTIPPSVAVANAVKILKGSSARWLFKQFPKLKTELFKGHLWSPSYYVGTAGNVSAATIEKYIERTEHVNKRR